jgi:hypothetical protein
MTAPHEDEVIDPDGLLGDPTGEPNDDGEGEGESATDAKNALGDAGKKALDAMKEKWRTERDARKAAEDKLAAASKPKPAEGEPLDVDALRKQIRDESRAEVLRERTLDKIEAKAAGRFRDPEDALLRLGRNVDEFIDGDKIDLAAIEDALVELLDKRPDFGVTQGEPKRFKGTADGGAKGTAGKPQLTEADVKKLSAAGKHDEINKAREAGQLDKLLGIT